jgi:hypothetical protein
MIKFSLILSPLNQVVLYSHYHLEKLPRHGMCYGLCHARSGQNSGSWANAWAWCLLSNYIAVHKPGHRLMQVNNQSLWVWVICVSVERDSYGPKGIRRRSTCNITMFSCLHLASLAELIWCLVACTRTYILQEIN